MQRSIPAFDAHMHVFDPRFPLSANHGYLPDPFTVADYQARVASLSLGPSSAASRPAGSPPAGSPPAASRPAGSPPVAVTGGAVVSASVQGFDQTYLLAALDALGPGWVGVTQLPVTAPDDQLRELDAAGVRAVRFNLRRGGGEEPRHLVRLAERVHDVVGWHVELYLDGAALADWEPALRALPSVSVDHLGLSAAALPILARLAGSGVRVKASGFGRVDFPVPAALRMLYDANPHALLFGTDLPSPRAPRPFADTDLDCLTAVFDDSELRRVLYDNARELYRPADR